MAAEARLFGRLFTRIVGDFQETGTNKNGYELALQVPEIVQTAVKEIGLVPGKDTSHTVKDREAFYSGYAEGVRFTDKDKLSV